MTILIFTEGTVLMPGSAKGKIREEIVQQSKKFRIEADYHFMAQWDYKTALKVYRFAKEFVEMVKKEMKKGEKKLRR